MNTKKILYGLSVAGICLNMVSFAGAEVMFSGSYSQDFDSITTAPPANWITGNYTVVQNRIDPGSKITDDPLVVDDGNSTTKGISYNYGTTGSSDRAIGQLPTTGTGDAALQVALSNNMGAPITQITIEYTGEQWRDWQGTSSSGPEKIRVYISNLDDGNFVYLPTLDFVAPQNTQNNDIALDGNDPANREMLSATIDLAAIGYTGGAIAPNESFYITWHDWNDNSTNDHALAVDDVRITGVPEPSTLALFSIFGLIGGFIAWRKRKRA